MLILRGHIAVRGPLNNAAGIPGLSGSGYGVLANCGLNFFIGGGICNINYGRNINVLTGGCCRYDM